MNQSFAVRKSCAVAFATSLCIMVLELAAGRIMAPYYGASLYVWAAIIGVVLSGIALGNYAGGKLADRWPSPGVLALILAAGSCLTIGVLPLANYLTRATLLDQMPFSTGFVVRTACVFLSPALVLSMATPLVVKQALADLGKTGGTIGVVYAWSTVGSIVGTFATGFALISSFGTGTTVWIVAGVLMATGIASLCLWPPFERRTLVVILLLCAICASLYPFRHLWQVAFTRESDYYAIQVVNVDASRRALRLDESWHSLVRLGDPSALELPYARAFAEAIDYVSRDNPAPRVLHLGGGAYSLPRYMEVRYPASTNDVVEIDPAVTDTVRLYFDLPASSSIRTFNEDARVFLMREAPKGRYDFVIGDAFQTNSVPYHLATLEFDRLVKEAMAPGGTYAVNVIDDFRSARLLSSIVRTLGSAFQHVYLLGTSGDQGWESQRLGNFIVVATDRAINVGDFERYLRAQGRARAGNLYPSDKLNQMCIDRDALLLTDDHVPVDALIASVYLPWLRANER